MDYSEFSEYSYSTQASLHSDGTETMAEPDTGRTRISASRLDLLPFFTTALQGEITEEEKWMALVFFSIHLGPWNMFEPQRVYSGASFSVSLLSKKSLLRHTTAKLDSPHLLRRQLAIKTPKLRQDGHSAHNSKLLHSLAKEYRILKSEPLAKHDNIVTVFGCCWQTLPTGPSQPTPTLIMEGTTLRDLSDFSRLRALTIRERLKLCLDITSGLEALHAQGVIHGDIKPNNILIFHPWGRGYTAKIADFGSSILLSSTELPCLAPRGTRLYRAPECANESTRLGRDDLIRTDLFSLGVTVSYLLIGSHISDYMMELSDSQLQSLKEGNQLASWILAHRQEDSASFVARAGSSKWTTDPSWNEYSIFSDDILCCWFKVLCDKVLAADSFKRVESAAEITVILRYMQHRHLHTVCSIKSKDSASWARLAALTNISHARMRKSTGQGIHSENRITKEEIIAIAHCCDQPGSFLKEAKFIIERNTKIKFKLLTRRPKWRHIKQKSSKPQITSTPIPAAILKLANKMIAYREKSINIEARRIIDTRLISLQNTVFKPSRASNIFWMLPQAVMEILKEQLLQEALDSRRSSVDRAEAEYEYAMFVLQASDNDPTEARISQALELLTFAARRGQKGAQASVGRLSEVFGIPLAASREEEMEWLLAASQAGSSTAQRQFRALDPVKFNAVKNDVRKKNGIICPLLNKELLERSYQVQQTGDLFNIFYGSLHQAAIAGNADILHQIPPQIRSDFYECENQLGETPLVIACREGHATVVKILLSRGANAAHTTANGVTPLHFLAAFNDEDITHMATTFLEHGAEVDKICVRDRIYQERSDSLFGQAGGTPLLWAVMAGNNCAVRALLAAGADPFITERPSATFDKGESPITYAAMSHQLDLLQSIVDLSGDKSELRKRFAAGGVGCSQGYRVFHYLIESHPAWRVRQYIRYGKEYQSVAVSCLRILIDSGLDPTCFINPIKTREDNALILGHPLLVACTTSNIAMIRFLWELQGGILKPPFELWITLLSLSVFHDLKTTFDFLINHREDRAENYDRDVRAVRLILSLTNDPYFTLGVLRLLQRPGVTISAEHAFELFACAVCLDHPRVARQILITYDISLTNRRGQNTFLNNLIGMSSNYPHMETRISFVLSLSPDKDSLFWNVGYLDNAGMTALQAAANLPAKTCPASPDAFTTVLQHFHEPIYLNAQLKGEPGEQYTGYTALHFAVDHANIHAVASLVNTPAIKTNLQSCRGETPLDICVDMVQQYQAEMEMLTPRSQLGQVIRNKSDACITILDLLLNAENEGRIAKYSTLLLRRTADEFTVVDARRGTLHGVALSDLVAPHDNLPLRQSCRALLEDAPIGGIVAFSSSTLVLPLDLRRRIDLC